MAQGEYYMEEAPNNNGEFETQGMRGIDLYAPPTFKSDEETFDVNKARIEDPIRLNYGEYTNGTTSKYDEEIADLRKLEDGYSLNNLRGEIQSGAAQFAAGLAKGTVLALTTMVDGILGTIVGIGNAAATGTFSGFWDNPLSNALEAVNRWSEEAIPNYYTKEEEEQPWYKNIFTANFLGDKVIKNLGFAVGAAYGGAPVARGVAAAMKLNKARQAFKGAIAASQGLSPNQVIEAVRRGEKFIDGIELTNELIKDAKKLRAAEPILKLSGALTGAIGEGRLEAISNTKDWADRETQIAKDQFNQVLSGERQALMTEFPEMIEYRLSADGKYYDKVLTPEGEAMAQERAKAKFDYDGALAKIEENRAKMGNVNFLSNIPLLTFGDIWQFGKIYAGGFNTAKRSGNILRTVAKDGTASYSVAGASKLERAARLAQTGLVEGAEEGNQNVISLMAGHKYGADLNDFYGAKIDPDSEAETISWMQALGKGIAETYGSAEGWEQVTIGALTGFMGIPGFRSLKSSEGKRQSPIYLRGGIREELQEMREERERDEELVNQLNNRVQSPEFLNYYQSAIRHNKYQHDMDNAIERNDNFDFKNAEHNQLINDVIMFSKAGRINDLYDLIDEAGNVKPEDIEQIRQLTTNQETGTSIYDGMTDDEVLNQIQRQAKDMKSAVDRYREISDAMQVKLGDKFEGDELEELTYYMSNIDNLESRFKEVFEDIKSTITPAIQELGETTYKRGDAEISASELLQMNPAQLIAEFSANQEEISKLLNSIPEGIENRNQEIQKKINDAVKAYQENPTRGRKGAVTRFLNKFDKLQEEIKRMQRDGVIVDGDELSNKLTDLIRLADKRLDFIDMYMGYINNPGSLRAKQEEQREAVRKNHDKEQIATTREKLSTAQNFSEFKDALEEEPDAEIRQKVIDELSEEGNPLAKGFKESQSYAEQVLNDLERQNIPEETKSRAVDLFNQMYNQGKSLQDVANPENALINNPEALYDENLDDEQNFMNFAEAQYALHSAMNRVNNANEFKDRFPREYLKPAERIESNKVDPERETTGSDETSTVAAPNEGPVDSYTPPAGDITPSEVLDENLEENGRSVDFKQHDNSQVGQRKYYRPSIPEFHIQGSKEGDFRPFNEIAKEREKGVNFDALYNYLRDNGAFSTVNEGNLKIGDELGFMIDPEFNDHTIFIVDNKTHQIVGSLDESEYSVARYEGLAELGEKVIKEYKESGKEGKFFATPTTRVSQIMVGKIPLGNQERSLGEIPGVSKESVFGIIKNGVLSTNGKLPNNVVVKPQNMGGKDGRMYILIKNAAGTYTPAAVRIKHFNESEFNPNDVAVRNTPLYKNLNETIRKLARAKTDEEVRDAISDLARSLYIRDLHINLQGHNLRLTKVQRDANHREIYDEVNGNRRRREDSKVVTLMDNSGEWQSDDEFVFAADGSIQTSAPQRSEDDIANDIMNVLMSFNLPLQVNIGMLNKGGYNTMLINSGVLTSNIQEAAVRSSWFTTDYFDKEGNLQQAFNPGSTRIEAGENTVGGLESSLEGTPVELGRETYYVDLTNNTVRNSNGQVMKSYPDSLFDMAYAQSNYGSSMNGTTMVNGVILLPSGKVLDRKTGKYVTGTEAESFKKRLTNRGDALANSKQVIASIGENQEKVDKSRTDGEFYYVMEDDGKYHEYKRVHSVLGSNWIQSEKQTSALNSVRTNLSKYAENVTQFNNYLKNLGNHYKINLDAFSGKTDLNSRDTIVNMVRDAMSGTNSQRALNTGSAVDSVIRNFFTSKEMPVRPDNMSEQAFNRLIDSLSEIKSNIEARGERFLTNNVVLFHKYNDGSRIAGEVDILAIDADGNFKIYDVKTSRYSFHDFIDKSGRKVNYFRNKSNTQTMSQEDYYTLQLSAYKNLFETQYHTPVTTLAILPFVLEYDSKESGKVSNITKENGIPIKYNPTVNVSLEGYVAPVKDSAKVNTPALNSSVEVITDAENPETPITPATLNEGNNQGAATLASNMNAIYKHNDKFEDDIVLRQVIEESSYPVWNREKEEEWFKKVLPQLSTSERYQVAKGLIEVAGQGVKAWGSFSKGIITLSDIAKEGTLYHEAFHAVFNMMLSTDEKSKILQEAREMFGEKSDRALEEDMAEGFREYVMTQSNKGLGRRILDFFRNLLLKIKNWNKVSPSLTGLYYNINRGKYTSYNLNDAQSRDELEKQEILNESAKENRLFDSLSPEQQMTLLDAGWTKEQYNSVSEEEREQALRCL